MSARFAATLIRSSTCRRSSTAASRSSSTLQVCSAPRRHSHARIRRVESVLPRPLPGSARACGADARGSRSTSPRVGRQQAVRHHPGRRGGSSAPGRVEQRGRPWLGSDQAGRTQRPDDLELGYRTQEWLATSGDAEAVATGGYWYQQRRSRVAVVLGASYRRPRTGPSEGSGSPGRVWQSNTASAAAPPRSTR
jgi:hypothetical protein